MLSLSASEAPLRATSSKSQPPHLVLDSHNYCHIQNLSFDHLLSGVIADYYEIREQVNWHESACPTRQRDWRSFIVRQRLMLLSEDESRPDRAWSTRPFLRSIADDSSLHSAVAGPPRPRGSDS